MVNDEPLTSARLHSLRLELRGVEDGIKGLAAEWAFDTPRSVREAAEDALGCFDAVHEPLVRLRRALEEDERSVEHKVRKLEHVLDRLLQNHPELCEEQVEGSP